MGTITRFFSVATVALSCVVASAQTTSNLSAGAVERARAMAADENWQGVADQLQLASATACHEFDDATLWLACRAAAHLADPRAEAMLRRYIAQYPASADIDRARMLLAGILFDKGECEQAVELYDNLDPGQWDAVTAQKLSLYKAGALVGVSRYGEAMSLLHNVTDPSLIDQALYYKGYIHYQEGDYDAAALDLSKVVKSSQAYPRALYTLAFVRFMQGNWHEAFSAASASAAMTGVLSAEEIAEACRIAGQSAFNLSDDDAAVSYTVRYVDAAMKAGMTVEPQATYILGVASYRLGNFEKAIEQLQGVSKLEDATGQSALLYLGQSYVQTGNNRAAMLALRRAASMDFDSDIRESAAYNYAVTAMKTDAGPFGSSAGALEQFLAEYPGSAYAPEVQAYLVMAYMTDNNYERALAGVERISDPSPEILRAKQQILYTLGCRNLAAGNTDLALSRLTQAAAINTADRQIPVECKLWIAECRYRKGDYDAASRGLLDYISTAPADAANRPVALYDLAYVRFAQKRYADALTDFERFMRNPGNSTVAMKADAMTRVADCYYYQSQFAKAASKYEEAYNLSPANGDYPLFQMALVRGALRDHKGRIDGMNRMLQEFPNSGLAPSALLELADAYGELGRKADAEATYERLASQYASTAQGRQGMLLLAITAADAGNRDKAMATYRDVIGRFPSSEEARMASDDLKRLYSESGDTRAYLDFMASVPSAPTVDQSELERMAYDAAAQKLATGDMSLMEKYLDQWPDGTHIEQALADMAAARRKAGDMEGAWDLFVALEQKAATPARLNAARQGVLDTSVALERWDVALTAASRLLESSTLAGAERAAVLDGRAAAEAALDMTAAAEADWAELAASPAELYGAKAAYLLAQSRMDSGDLVGARANVEKLIEANPPHAYWLARGFILLSDINRAEGNDFEADEYLRTLKANYPGNEPDILDMISSRLK